MCADWKSKYQGERTMKKQSICKGTLAAMASTLAATTYVSSAAAWENPLENPHMSAPLEICDQGSFFVGGVPKVTEYAAGPQAGAPQQITIGQAYVQFQVPKKRRKWPIIFVHGSTHTGAALDSTPDGNEGWHSYAVRNNLASFVMDQPGRGRSGFDQSVLHEAKGTNNWNLVPTFGRITDNGAWTTWFGHIIDGTTIVDGKMIRHSDPGDPDGPDDPKQPSPAHGKYLPKFPIPPVPHSADPKLVARKGAIGPAPNAVNNTYLGLEYYKQLVPNGEVTLPGSTCEKCTPQLVAPNNTWLPVALADLLEGIGGGIVAPHSQSGPSSLHLVRVLKERGKLHLLKGIITPEGATDLAAAGVTGSDFDTIPFLMMNGDYRPLATRQGNYAAVAAMNASPTRKVGPALAIDAEDPRFKGKFLGHTHMGMLGSTAIAQFDFFLDWAEKNIPNPVLKTSCKANGKPGHGHGHGHEHGPGKK
jgi:hypothetical protein